MAIPPSGKFYRPALEIVAENGATMSYPKLIETLTKCLSLTEDDLQEKVYIQAKRYDTAQVGELPIRNLAGRFVARSPSKGAFITTSNFSSTAEQTARTISAGNQFISLIDGQGLAILIISHNVGVVPETTYVIKKLDENYFAEDI